MAIDPATVAPAASAGLSLDDIDAMLPAHLRKPLPLDARRDPKPAVAESDDIMLASTSTSASAIETFYRKASGDETLTQYGYDVIGTAGTGNAATESGAVQDDYVLGAGDRLTIAFMGERKDKQSYTIDRTGALNIDQLPPLAAAGKTLGDLRADLQHMMAAQSYHGDLYLSLEQVRQIGVLVAGQVAKPGRHTMTPLQSVLEALEQSGGILPSGSLRQIRLIRDGRASTIDLYDVINGRSATPLPLLQDGDRVIVAALGPTMAVIGDVRQPGIYELPAPERISVATALQMAGGPMSRGENRVVLQSPTGDGKRTAQEVTASSTNLSVGDGAIIGVNRTLDRSAASFQLSGETRRPGTYPLSAYRMLSELLAKPEAFGEDVYPLLGVISRRRDADLTRDLIAFSPQDVFARRADSKIADGDSIWLFSRADVRAIMKGQSMDDMPDLVSSFVHEHAVSLQGAVRIPGMWPVAGPMPVARLLDVAGGPLSAADLSHAEINRNDVGLVSVDASPISRRDVVDLSDAAAQGVTVTAGDAVRIPDRFEAVTTATVTIRGEVRNPGTYDLMRGDTMLSLIDRAGGLTDQGYPLGTVFSRAAERRREKERFAVAARDLERSIAMASNKDDGRVDTTQLALAKDLVDELKTIEPVGRITVESDPGILRRDPAQDILLESDDVIFIPKRPLTVRVTGEVLSPAALQFRADKDAGDYLSEAGGTTKHADDGRIFVLYPNGAAQPLRTSFTQIKPVMIIPGSTLVVPRDPKPFSFIDSAKDITQILSNLAITGIYANDLRDKD